MTLHYLVDGVRAEAEHDHSVNLRLIKQLANVVFSLCNTIHDGN